MSEFHNAFYITCKKHDVEHPKWRKCPKCIEVVTYSEEDVLKLIEIINWYDNESDVCPNYYPFTEGKTMWEWFESFKNNIK